MFDVFADEVAVVACGSKESGEKTIVSWSELVPKSDSRADRTSTGMVIAAAILRGRAARGARGSGFCWILSDKSEERCSD